MSDRDDGVSYVLGTNPRQYQVEFSPVRLLSAYTSFSSRMGCVERISYIKIDFLHPNWLSGSISNTQRYDPRRPFWMSKRCVRKRWLRLTVVHIYVTQLPMVESFRSLPRFSHSDDFSKLFSNDPEEVKDYSLGLLFLAIFIMSFFLVWTFIICLLKCIGPRYVGVLSGFPFKREGYKSRTGRVTLIFSCLSIIVLAVLVVVKGLAELQITSDTIALTSADVTAISTELGSIVDHLRNVTEWITPVRDSLVTVLQEDICPLQPGSESETDVRLIGNDTLVAMTRLDNFIANDLDDVEQVLVQLTRATTDVEQAVSDVQFNSAVVSAVMIPYYIIPAFLILAVVMGWNQIFSENYYNFVTWFIIPFLCLLTAFAIVVSGWVVLSIEANSDFCSPTPEDTISSILQQYNLQSEEMYYDVITFYTRQCDVNVATNPWIFLEAFFDQLVRRTICYKSASSFESAKLSNVYILST